MAWIGLAGFAGSVTGLSFMPWKAMPASERVLTLGVGTAFAAFAVPWILIDLVKMDLNALRAACGAAYLGGTVANRLLLVVIRRAGGALNGIMDRLFGKEGQA